MLTRSPNLPRHFTSTRESLRALACYVMAPAARARTGHISLRATGDGFGTPSFDDGTRILVQGDQLSRPSGQTTEITSLRDAAAFIGVTLVADPGVGHDLPPFAPDNPLMICAEASLALGSWYELGRQVLGEVTEAEPQLWPEHFDLAVVLASEAASGPIPINVGFSPGDSSIADPYVYVGPHATGALEGRFWNAPFGAYLPFASLMAGEHPMTTALAFIRQGCAEVGRIAQD